MRPCEQRRLYKYILQLLKHPEANLREEIVQSLQMQSSALAMSSNNYLQTITSHDGKNS